MENSTVKTQLNHRSIRAFRDEKIPDEILDTLLDVANHTSTSMGMQSYSIIRVTDREIRKKISEICNQAYVNDAPEFWVYIVDLFRNAAIAAEQGCYLDSRCDMDRFFQGFTDASIAAQNVMVALESMGLGGVYFGSILNDPLEIIRLLNLPEYTFPVFGFGFGYPAQDPQLKPRMDMKFKVFENSYRIEDNYLDMISGYDREMQTYYDLRNADKAMDSFSKQVVDKLKTETGRRAKILNDIRRQGFDFQMEYIPDSEIRTMFRKPPEKTEEHVFEESRSGIRLDTKVSEIFVKYPFVKEYLLMINPKFNQLKTLSSTLEFEKMDMKDLADLGEMPADALIYMIESRISEE